MAWASKKLPALYSLTCRTAGSAARACSICPGTAPVGTRVVVVFFHKSHIRQRNGHSRLVRRIVATSSIVPYLVRSGSTKKACGRCGSVGLRGGR
jgi:hypothetical protein